MKKLIIAALALGGVIWVANRLKDNIATMNAERIKQISQQS